jgi:HD-like signal output (HDOD) protein
LEIDAKGDLGKVLQLDDNNEFGAGPSKACRNKNMKRSIYVVDDQAPVLETTVLVLRSLGRDWEVTGFTDPFAALEAVKAKAPDAILSDELMPGMQGSQLLEQIRAVSPNTVRLIMSGCVALDKLTLITSAHQYIAKPFDAFKLRDLIQRSFTAQERIVNQGLQALVTSIRSIPSLPQAHQSLLKELEDSDTPSATIARLIGNDPGLSVKVLQLANSALFGRGYLVTSPIDAVSCLGTDMIAAIVLSQTVFHHYESLQHREIDLPRVWAHCWETARLAQHFCREKKLPHKTGEEAFLAGLLHEAGRFILVDNFPDKFQAACDGARHSKIPLPVCLREAFQASLSQISSYVLELWGLPGAVINSIYFQDDPEKDPAPGFSMTSALYIADHLASRTFPPDSFSLEDWKTGYLQSIGCADDIPIWEKLSTNPE